MRATLIACVLSLAATPALAQQGGGLQRPMAMDLNGDGQITRAEAVTTRAAGFARLDVDRDGSLSEAERQAIRGRMAGAIGRADANSDGRVSRSEFMAMPYAGFDRLDANRDDVVSAQEMEVVRGLAGGG